MSKGKFALGAIFGAAIGVAAGMLTAPKSGKETRAELKDKANKYKADAEQKRDEVKDKANAKRDELKGKAEEYKERGTNALQGAIEGAKKGFQSQGESHDSHGHTKK